MQFRRALVEKWSALKPKIPEEPAASVDEAASHEMINDASHEVFNDEAASHEMIIDEAASRELIAELNDDAQPLMVIKRENNMSNSFLETNL